jgi:DNA invertase Pin-like site-specific DNA recombinase
MEQSKLFLNACVAYVRDYKKESKNVYSIEEQEKAIGDYCAKNGYMILEVFKESNVSAKDFNRPVFQEMLKYFKENKYRVKCLIVSDHTRLSTNTTGFQKLRFFLRGKGVRLISIVQFLLKHMENK